MLRLHRIGQLRMMYQKESHEKRRKIGMGKRGFRVLLSGGGTGGHIYPALAIADALRMHYGVEEILFVGAKGRMEMELVPRAGYRVVGLRSVGMPRGGGIWRRVRFGVLLLWSVWRALWLVLRFRPSVVIGVGGYVSVPAVLAAQLLGIPTILQEQNSFAGVANRFLSKRARLVCVAYEGMEKAFRGCKVVFTGNPVRAMFTGKRLTQSEARSALGLPEEGKMVLVLGGSLGAASVNEAVVEGVKRLRGKDYFLLLQTGSRFYDSVCASVAEHAGDNLFVRPFLDEMDMYYRAADLIVARAGASTVSELGVVGCATILVPSPNVVEDHQNKNAQALAAEGAAVVVRDEEVKKTLIDCIEQLLADEERLAHLSARMEELGRPNASRAIAQLAWDEGNAKRVR